MNLQSHYLKLYDALAETETDAKLLKKINVWIVHFIVLPYMNMLIYYPKDKANQLYLKNYLDKYLRRISFLEYISAVSFKAYIKLRFICSFPFLVKPTYSLWRKTRHFLKKR